MRKPKEKIIECGLSELGTQYNPSIHFGENRRGHIRIASTSVAGQLVCKQEDIDLLQAIAFNAIIEYRNESAFQKIAKEQRIDWNSIQGMFSLEKIRAFLAYKVCRDLIITSIDQQSTFQTQLITQEDRVFADVLDHGYVYIADKPGGVEPGELCCRQTDIARLQEIASRRIIEACKNESCVEEASNETKNNPFGRIANQLKINLLETQQELPLEIIRVFLDDEACKKEIIADILREPDFSVQLIKQNYDNPGRSGVVSTSTERAKKHSTTINRMRKVPLVGRAVSTIASNVYCYFSQKEPREANWSAIAECLATRITECLGVLTHDQRLMMSYYHNDFPKILMVSTWEKKFTSFSDQLRGSRHRSYLAIENQYAAVTEQPEYISSNPIIDLYEYLIPLLRLGDFDLIGPEGDNKGCLNVGDGQEKTDTAQKSRFYGIDFGHPFPKENPILTSLQDDATFDELSCKSLFHNFSNFSIFFDSLLSERIKGVHFLYKLRMGCNPPRETIEEYKKADPNFEEKLNNIKQDRDIKIFDAFKEHFLLLSKDANKKGYAEIADEFKFYASEIERVKQWQLATDKEILDKFEARRQLTPRQVDLLDNLEKLVVRTSARDSSNTVWLNHLRRVSNSKHVSWEFNRIKSDKKGSREKIELSAELESLRYQRLIGYKKHKFDRGKNEDDKASYLEIVRRENKVIISFYKDNLEKVINFFSEESIANYKSRNDKRTSLFVRPTQSEAALLNIQLRKREAKEESTSAKSTTFKK